MSIISSEAERLYTTKDAADQLYGEYGEETEVEE